MYADARPSFEHTKYTKQSSSKDYEALLRLTKEKYEERLRAITDRVRIIYQETCEDEVLATMREDPVLRSFAAQRTFEICKDNLALEREETIEKLISELTYKSETLIRLRKENKELHDALVQAHDKCANMSKHKEIYSKLHKNSTYFHDKSLDEDIKQLQAIFEETEFNLSKKTNEFELLLYEYNLEKNKNLELLQEIKDLEENKEQLSKEQEIRSMNSHLKKQMIEQTAVIAKLENELESTKLALEASRNHFEHSLQEVHEDLTEAKDTWELQCQELISKHANEINSLENSHSVQLKELQKHYQHLLGEKLNEFTVDTSKQRKLEEEFSKKLEDRVKEISKDFISKVAHLQALKENELNLKNKHSDELKELEENLAQKFNSKLKEIREEYQSQIEKLKDIHNNRDDERSQSIISLRKTETELEYANQKIENLNGRISSLNSDISYLENSKINLMQKIEGISLDLAKNRAQCEEETLKKQQIQSDLEIEKQKYKEIEQDYQEITAKYQKLRNDMKNYEKSLLREQNNNQELRDKLSKLQDNEKAKKLAEDLLKENKETKRVLKQAEKETDYLSSELESSLETIQAYKNQINELEAQLIDLKRQLYSFKHVYNDNESELSHLRSQNLHLKHIVSQLRYQSKEHLSKLKSDLKTTSRITNQDLGTFKLSFIQEIGEILINLQQSNQSKDRQISQRQLEIQSLSKMLKEAQDTLSLLIQEQSNYEISSETLKDTISSLTKETQHKNQELSKHKNSLQESSDLRRTLERENKRLEHDLKVALTEIENLKDETMKTHKQEQELYQKQLQKFKGLAYSLQEELESIESKTTGVFEQLQNEFTSLHQSVAEDKMNSQKFKTQKTAEIEALKTQVKTLNTEINMKQELVEKAQEETEIARRKEIREGNQQVLELKGKLAQSFHSTLETVKQARELEKETHQLSLQAREEYRNSDVSLASLRTSLEK